MIWTGLLDEFVAEGAFPGGVVAVGYRGALVHLHPFGRLSYDEDAARRRRRTRSTTWPA